MTTGGWTEGRVTEWQRWAEGLATLRLAAEVQPFEAGQFFQLGLDIGGERIRRSYSASSAPGAPLEFFLTNVPGGALTPALFRLEEGARLWVETTPRGFFTLRYVPPCEHLWMVATGTGLGPYVAMLRAESTWSHARQIVLVHGVRSHEHLAYRDELEALSQERSLRYVPIVSGTQGPRAALQGRVTTALESGALERAAGLSLAPADSHVLLCGNPVMIGDMMALLEARGLRKHRARQPGHVTFEKYW